MSAGIVLALLLVAAPRMTLFDETVQTPRFAGNIVTVSLQQRPGIIECSFQSLPDGGKVKMSLMSERDRRILAATGFDRKGSLSYDAGQQGQYMVLLENERGSRSRGKVQLKVDLIYNDFTSFAPRTLPRERQTMVVAFGLVLFLAIGVWSGRQLLSAVRNRSAGSRD